MIETLSVQFSVKECCVALSVSRSGYYRWAADEPSLAARANAQLVKQIRRLYAEHKGRYGSPRITAVLRQEGVRCGENRVARLMRENKLAARRKRAFRPRTTLAGQAAAPNLIKELAPSGPDQIWASDITYVATAEGWLYLAVILDLFSRRVIGWKLADGLDASLVQQALQNALILRQPKAGLYFHSDRGCQYSSHLVRKPHEVIGALTSMSALGNCYDNAKAEAFFSTLKTECFPPSNCFESKAQARSTLFEYIEVYDNNQRLHSALGYKSPRQYESGYQPEKESTFSKEKVTATSSAEGGAKVKRANGINGGKPVGGSRLCRIATLTVE